MAVGTSPINFPQSSNGRLLGHYRTFQFVTTHDDLKQIFTTTLGQLLHAHVVKNQEVRFEILGHLFVMTLERFVMQQVSHGGSGR